MVPAAGVAGAQCGLHPHLPRAGPAWVHVQRVPEVPLPAAAVPLHQARPARGVPQTHVQHFRSPQQWGSVWVEIMVAMVAKQVLQAYPLHNNLRCQFLMAETGDQEAFQQPGQPALHSSICAENQFSIEWKRRSPVAKHPSASENVSISPLVGSGSAAASAVAEKTQDRSGSLWCIYCSLCCICCISGCLFWIVFLPFSVKLQQFQDSDTLVLAS